MKKILWLFLVVCLAAGCRFESGSGNIVTQTRNTPAFTGVSAGGGFDVEITTGSTTKVVVEADDNVIDNIETSVQNGQLKISMKNSISYNDAHMKVFITAPEINRIKSSASAEIEVKGELRSANKVDLDASSGSSITAAVNAPDVDAGASSGAEVNLSGRTKNFVTKASSGADVSASELLSETTTADASSGATAKVHASVKLDAHASSGGNIDYRGAAAVTVKESSGGSVEKNNE